MTSKKRPTRAQVEAAGTWLHLLPTAPIGLVRLAWKYMAKLHHPDKGGSNWMMQKINEAHEILELEELYRVAERQAYAERLKKRRARLRRPSARAKPRARPKPRVRFKRRTKPKPVSTE